MFEAALISFPGTLILPASTMMASLRNPHGPEDQSAFYDRPRRRTSPKSSSPSRRGRRHRCLSRAFRRSVSERSLIIVPSLPPPYPSCRVPDDSPA